MSPNAAQAQTSAPIPSGLVSWWRGEGNANDSQGSNNGTLLGGISFAPGMVGQAFSLDGSSGYVRVPASPSLPTGNAPRTLMLWVYTRPSSWDMNANTIFHWGNSSYREAFSLDMHYYRQMEFYTWSDDIYFDPQVPAEGWVHVALTYDGFTAKVYTQGQLIDSKDYAGGLNTGYADITIGTLDWLNSYFDGLIDEVALFNRALDQTEIQAVYNAGSAGMSANSPPNVSAATPSTASIWPPNNKMVPITINGVTDPDGDAVSITITGITNNETGSADATGIGTSTAQVRATRNGKGTGRTYTISFTAADGKGGSTTGSVTVLVPHDQGGEVADDDDHGDDHGKVEKKDDAKKKDEGKAEKKDGDKDKKKDDGKDKKSPAKRAKPTAVENASWGEVKHSQQ
ncbi:MAG: hypothetical protein IT369_03635 [Candidatus Latescibacteria bacterium]|nr:hypothetical protein [Candidatus Latescibacterota bacterium]